MLLINIFHDKFSLKFPWVLLFETSFSFELPYEASLLITKMISYLSHVAFETKPPFLMVSLT
jgi:hypothetical protein